MKLAETPEGVQTLKEFPHVFTPFDHQYKELVENWDREYRAILMEQGTGKTKLFIDTAMKLFVEGKIDGVLVIAPNGVHDNWALDELPKHLTPEIMAKSNICLYQTRKSGTKQHQRAVRQCIAHEGLAIMCMSYDAIMTAAGKAAAWNMLRKRELLYGADESIDIKSPGAKRTLRVCASAKYAKYRRIMNGTLVSNGPFDVQSQFKFLDWHFWERFELKTPAEFRVHFGIFKTRKTFAGGKEREFEQCVGYKRLDELHDIIAPVSTRVLKKDVLDLPPKLYGKLYFDMNPEQKRVYKDVENDGIAYLVNGEMVTTPLPIVRDLRLAQITSGYVPTDDPEDEPIQMLGDTNPRLTALMQQIRRESNPTKVIIWAKFKMDIDLIMEALREEGLNPVKYNGDCTDDEKIAARQSFQNDPDVGPFVGNAQAAGRGLTLTAALQTYYYNNTFNLTQRLQSEDRNHRIGTDTSVKYTDLIARGTIDARIVKNLRSKLEVADIIAGDDHKDWI